MTPSGWRDVTLGELVTELVSGKSPDIPETPAAQHETGILKTTAVTWAGYDESKNRVVPDPSIVDSKQEVRAGDVLITKAGPVHRVGVAVHVTQTRPKLHVSGKMVRLRVNESADPAFIAYAIGGKEVQQHLLARTTGMALSQTNLKHESIVSACLALPPIAEQRKIAAILSSVDDTIEKTEAVIDQLKVVKKSMMEELLTRGMPGRHTRFDGKRPAASWRVGVVGDFLTLQRGFDITERQVVSGSVPVVSSSGVSYFHNEAKVMPPGVVTGRKGKLGGVFYLDQPCWPHDTSLWVADFKGNCPRYVYWFLQWLRLERLDSATAVPTLNRNNVHPLPAAFPSHTEQEQIANVLDVVEAREESSVEHLRQLQVVKSSLLSCLLTGEVRVPVSTSEAAA